MSNKKPVGSNGIIRIHINKKSNDFIKIKLPENKVDIEKLFATRFLQVIKEKKWFKKYENTNLSPNQENDLDFIVNFTCETYLELMEIAPLDYFKTDFENAPNLYYDYDFAKYILEKIIKKSNKYKSIKDRPIYLLLYITDWKFLLSDTVISLLQYWLAEGNHSFTEIYYITYTIDDSNDLFLIYPTEKEYFKNFNENKYKKNITYLPDPNKWKSMF
ncbi:MAG: hypothetical protein PHS06_02115 [Candidatus Shapirobacteria bacterium]|nr:hypothetical protein [Candidatus Shapirobacteria bacterium]